LNKLELVREYYLGLRGCCAVDVENALNKAVGAIAYVQSVPDEDDGCAILVAVLLLCRRDGVRAVQDAQGHSSPWVDEVCHQQPEA